MTEDWGLELSAEEDAAPEDVKAVWDGLASFNLRHAPNDHRFLRVFVGDQSKTILGGLLADTSWGWLHINILWLEESVRLRGLGSRLLAMAEAEAIERGCGWASLDTLSFQARPFYEKQGCSVFAELQDNPKPNTRYLMKKRLIAD